jgi:hypothetical protein
LFVPLSFGFPPHPPPQAVTDEGESPTHQQIHKIRINSLTIALEAVKMEKPH